MITLTSDGLFTSRNPFWTIVFPLYPGMYFIRFAPSWYGHHMIISPRHSIFKNSQPVVCPDTWKYFGKVAFKSVKFWYQLGWLGKLATFWALTVTPPPTSTTICWGTTPFIPYSKLYTGLKSTKIIQKETASSYLWSAMCAQLVLIYLCDIIW